MERVVHKFKSFQEAEVWEIDYYLNLSPEERIQIARELQWRFYGSNPIDVRVYYRETQ